jgi:hypothetical protein
MQHPLAGFDRKVLICTLALLLCVQAGLLPTQAKGATARPVPFVAGEKLVFHVDWNPPWYLFFIPTVEAGKAELQVEPSQDYKERRTLKISFRARSSGTFVKLIGFKVDDSYEYLTDAETLCTISAIRRERQGKRKRDIAVTYMPETRQLHLRDVDLAVNPAKVKRAEIKDDIPPCVRDLFSALYWVRSSEFHLGAIHKASVGYDDKIKEVKSHVEKKETVTTPLGKFETWKVNTVAILGGLLKNGGHFRFWVTDDDRHLPVRFEATLSLGKVTGKIESVDPPLRSAEKIPVNTDGIK